MFSFLAQDTMTSIDTNKYFEKLASCASQSLTRWQLLHVYQLNEIRPTVNIEGPLHTSHSQLHTGRNSCTSGMSPRYDARYVAMARQRVSSPRYITPLRRRATLLRYVVPCVTPLQRPNTSPHYVTLIRRSDTSSQYVAPLRPPDT